MLRKITVWVVVAVAAVVSVQVLLRNGAPPSLVKPPKMQLPALDPPAERGTSQPENPSAEPGALGDGARDPSVSDAAAPEIAADGPRRVIFDCGNGLIFSVRTMPTEATLFSPQALGGEVITLPQVDAESGARYAVGQVSYWNKG